MKFTRYFVQIRQRPDRAKIRIEWIEDVIRNSARTEIQSDGRIKKWKKLEEENKYLRVIYFLMGKPFTMLSLMEF